MTRDGILCMPNNSRAKMRTLTGEMMAGPGSTRLPLKPPRSDESPVPLAVLCMVRTSEKENHRHHDSPSRRTDLDEGSLERRGQNTWTSLVELRSTCKRGGGLVCGEESGDGPIP